MTTTFYYDKNNNIPIAMETEPSPTPTPTTPTKATNIVFYKQITDGIEELETISLSQLTKHTNPNNSVTLSMNTFYIIPGMRRGTNYPSNFIMCGMTTGGSTYTITSDYYSYITDNGSSSAYALLTNASSLTEYTTNSSNYMGLMAPVTNANNANINSINIDLIDTSLLPTE